MEVTAKLKYLRLTPRKVRAVLDVIRGLDVVSAEAQLNHLPKRASKIVLKLLNSAVSNALNRYAVKKEDLFIKEIFADEGPTLYRWFPKAFGRATPIRKRSSHLTIVLSSKKEAPPKEKIKEEIKKEEIKKEEVKEELSKTYKKREKEIKKSKEDLKLKRREGFIKRFFRRKTI